MVNKAHLISSLRLFKKHLARFLTIAAIALVAIAFTSGLGEVEEQIKHANANVYEQKNISDLYIKSKTTIGFSQTEQKYIVDTFGEENVAFSFCIEFTQEDEIYRIIVLDLSKNEINRIEYTDGVAPKNSGEVLFEQGTYGLKSHAVGEVVHLSLYGFEKDLTVSGVVLHPMYLYKRDNVAYSDQDDSVDYILYLDYSALSDLAGFDLSMKNDAYVLLPDLREDFNAFSSRYKKSIDAVKTEIVENLGEDNVSVLTLWENVGMYSMIVYAEKVGLIGIVFVVFFLLVTLLVVYSAMNRLFAEERGQIACQKTLGYSEFSIVGKYLFFDFAATAVGGTIAYGVGLALTKLIYNAFSLQYAMPAYPADAGVSYYLVCFAIIALGTLLLTLITGMRTVRQRPVSLLAQKAPKAGRKVIVEKIPFIWNHLSFKHKSTVRNVLLFRSRFYMTVLSVLGAAVLVFAGFGVMDVSVKIPGGSTLISISILVVAFSAMMCALVIYNLTNINVSERCREIATLMVLGYSDEEVTGYVYREIYVMCSIGALLGVPAGCLFIQFVFDFVGIGTVSDVNWWTYLVTPVLTMLFCFLSTRLLRRKITGTDMNASLKTLE